MGSAKLGAIVMSALVVMYLALLGQYGVLFLQQPNAVSKVMGIAILVLPCFGAWGIYIELRFGLRIERLARRLEAEGNWPRFEFGTYASGRAIKKEAEAVFDKYREQAQASPDDWRSWFTLGLAYDATGDRRRARAAMRKSLVLAQTNR